MAILLIQNQATQEELQKMLEDLGDRIKVAVDIARSILVGGGMLHADCEAVLFQQGSGQEDIWGADWYPKTKTVRCEAMINLAPRRKNRSMEIQDPKVRERVESIVKSLLGNP